MLLEFGIGFGVGVVKGIDEGVTEETLYAGFEISTNYGLSCVNVIALPLKVDESATVIFIIEEAM